VSLEDVPVPKIETIENSSKFWVPERWDPKFWGLEMKLKCYKTFRV